MAEVTWTDAAATPFVWMQRIEAALTPMPNVTILQPPTYGTDASKPWPYDGSADTSGMVLRVNHPTTPFVIGLYSPGSTTTGAIYYRIAEDFDPATGTWLRICLADAATGPWADDSVTGPNWVDNFRAPGGLSTSFGGSATSGHPSAAIVMEDFIALYQPGGMAHYFGLFDSVVDSSPDPACIGNARFYATSGFLAATRAPGLSTYPSPVSFSLWRVMGWMNPALTAATGGDPWADGDPSATRFTHAVIANAPVAGTSIGAVRGASKNILVSRGGAVGEAMTIPGEGVYRKVTSDFWLKTEVA